MRPVPSKGGEGGIKKVVFRDIFFPKFFYGTMDI